MLDAFPANTDGSVQFNFPEDTLQLLLHCFSVRLPFAHIRSDLCMAAKRGYDRKNCGKPIGWPHFS